WTRTILLAYPSTCCLVFSTLRGTPWSLFSPHQATSNTRAGGAKLSWTILVYSSRPSGQVHRTISPSSSILVFWSSQLRNGASWSVALSSNLGNWVTPSRQRSFLDSVVGKRQNSELFE
ncbi:hypothetical protein EXIGLDRAFT_833780, partial [Exidia glandulosa HHB12029]